MSYQIEENGDIVINGWEKGISDDPYTGISDMRGVNIISIPGETSVNFATRQLSTVIVTDGNVTSADTGTDTITFTGATGGLENGMAVYFTGASLPTGITANTIYWANNVTATTCTLDTTYAGGTTVNITADGTGTMVVVPMGTPKYYAYDSKNDKYWFVDSNGRVWSNKVLTFSNYFKFTGNTVDATSNGNGLLYFEATDGTGYIFVWRNSRIDYTPTATVGWVYGWDPIDATTGNTDAYLNTAAADNRPHHAIVGQGNTVYYTDNQYVGSWFQADPLIAFVPTTLSTYSFAKQAVGIELTDQANCLAILSNNIFIGGSRNAIYAWNRLSFGYQYRILLAETNVSWMEVVNTTVYIFVGNRGRIYVTNGVQAKLFKKVPDHLSGTVEPYFTWGGVGSVKNQLYFGVYATDNANNPINTYGGLWAIDMDTGAIRVTNQLSYGDYTGYASLIIPAFVSTTAPTNPQGAGLYVGWPGGIDVTSRYPYGTYVSYIDSDLIPIGTFLQKRTLENVEFKLTNPMVSGEGVKVSYRLQFSDSYTQIGETTTVGVLSDVYLVNFENAQWVQFRIETKSVSAPGASPSYTRFKELRIR
jgi:hypothetical protein